MTREKNKNGKSEKQSIRTVLRNSLSDFKNFIFLFFFFSFFDFDDVEAEMLCSRYDEGEIKSEVKQSQRRKKKALRINGEFVGGDFFFLLRYPQLPKWKRKKDRDGEEGRRRETPYA